MGSKSRREFTTHFFLRTGSLGNLNSCLPVLVELEQFGAEQPPIGAVLNKTPTPNLTLANVKVAWLSSAGDFNHYVLTRFKNRKKSH